MSAVFQNNNISISVLKHSIDQGCCVYTQTAVEYYAHGGIHLLFKLLFSVVYKTYFQILAT